MPVVVCISDTHGGHELTEVPPGDILIHAGDMTRHGTLGEVEEFNSWLGSAKCPHPYKVVIAGNHDWCFQRFPGAARERLTNAVYLEDAEATVAGMRVYGSPWQPWFFGWAFNLERGPDLAAKWVRIPNGLDILVTHGPPEGVLDMTKRWVSVGDADLLARVREAKPQLHVFGHIHEAAGVVERGGTLFVNASTMMGIGAGVVVNVWADGCEIA